MKNLWNDKEAQKFNNDLDLRVYSSNILGKNDELVLHGGGNTSVKIDDILYVKGSGWDLVSIKAEGFASVNLEGLKQMAKLKKLSDKDMVSKQKELMINKSAPNPSVEAILHSIIPFKFVDHTHADSIVTITNSKNGEEYIKKLYPNFLIVPYIMPGFILAQKIYQMSKDLDWEECDGIILHNHGIFTFDDDAKKSYTKMINSVTIAEDFLDKFAKLDLEKKNRLEMVNFRDLKIILEKIKGYKLFMIHNNSILAQYFATQKDLKSFVSRGVLTPEHILRTKRVPLILNQNDNIEEVVKKYQDDYLDYFKKFVKDEIMLNSAPNWIVVENIGIISLGKNEKEAKIIADINEHTIKAILRADMLGGFESISLKDSFDMEYWELEQMKLKK